MTGSNDTYKKIRKALIHILDDRLDLKYELSLVVFKNALLLDFTLVKSEKEWTEILLNTENIGQKEIKMTIDVTTPFDTYKSILHDHYKGLQDWSQGFNAELKGNLNIINKLKLMKLFDIHYYKKYTKLKDTKLMNKINNLLEIDPIYNGLNKYQKKTFNDDLTLLETIEKSLLINNLKKS